MENSWMNKCTSSWSSVPSSSASQNQNQQQGVKNQMKISGSSFIHPYGMQGVSSQDNGVVGVPMVFNSLNSGSCRSNKPELGNSFLSLLSGPSSQVQHRIQPMPSSTTHMDCSSLPLQNNNRVFSSDNYGTSPAPVGLLSLRSGNCNRKTGPEYCLVEPSCAASTGIHQMGNITSNSESNREGLRPAVGCNEMGTDLLYPRQGWLSNFYLANDQNNTRNIRTTQKMPSVTVSAASGPAPTSKKGSLRVFCLATNGDLLLNNKGLLGVVCLCHGLQMSISKFCEHSGSCIVNPGDAVRLKSGETVSHWRRHCFPKYGIRVPDDNSGWDWPEKTPATVGLVNHKPTAPNISKNSDMFKVDPFITSPKTAERWNSFVSPNNSHRGDCVAGNTFGDVMHDLRQNNVQEGCIFSLKSLDETAQVHLPAPLDTQAVHMIKGGARSHGLEKAREGSGYHSVADYIGFLTKGSDPLIANQSLGNFTFLGTCSDVNRCHGSMEASTAERDSTSSNIELRLGQPSQQSYNLEGSVISALHPQPYVAHSNSQKSLLHDRRFHNAVIPEVTEEPRQHLRHVHSNTSNSPRTENKLSFRQFASMDPAKVEQFKGDMAKSSHMLFSHPSAVSERDVMHRARNNMINYGEAFTSSGFLGEYHGTNGSSNIPRSKHYGTQTQLNNNILCHLNHIDKGKIGHHIADNCIYDTEKGNSLFDHMASSSHFMGVFSNNHLPSGTTMNGRQSSYWCRPPGSLEDTSFIDNQSNPHGKASFLQGSNCFDQVTPGAVNPSTLSSGPNLPLPKVSTGFSSTNPVCKPSLMQLLSNKESDVTPHFLDENLGLLALRHMFDLSKQNHEIITHNMEQKHEGVYDSLTIQMQQRVSKGSEVSAEQMEGPNCTFTKSTPVFAPKLLQSRPNDYVNGEHLPSATGAKTWCNFSTSSHGISFHSKEQDIGHPPLSSRKDKQVLPCLGSIENNSMTCERDVCSRREPSALFTGNSSCIAVHSNSVARNYVSIGEAPSGPNEEHSGRFIGNMLKLVPSKVDDDHMVQVAKTRNQSENLNRQIHLRNGCHASQWKDVPSKHVVVGNATHLEKSTEVYGVGNVEAKIVMNAGKRFEGRTQVAESLNEQQMPTVYSACSAPAITEITFEANTTDSCTVDAENDRYVNEDVVDEGSGIERCWSSDDAFDSERSTKTIEFHKFNSTKGGKCSTYLPSPSSRDSADNLRLRGAFGQKKVHRLPDGCSVNESINKKQHLQSNLKTGKKKKTVKWKRLDVSFPASALSSVQHESTKRIEDTDSYSCSSRGTQVLFKPSAKRKHSSLMSAKTLSRKRNLCELSDNHREWEGDGRKHMKEDMNPQKLSKSSSEKKLKQCCVPDMKKQFSGQELNQRAQGKAAKYCSMPCSKGFLRNQIDTFAKKRKPVVCGRYGVISNGELGEDQLKPAKIVSLSTILKTARRCSTPKIEEPGIILNVDTKKTSFTSSEDEGIGSEGCGDVMKNKAVVGNCMFNTKKSCLKEDEVYVELLISEKEENDTNGRMFKYGTICSGAPLKSRFKEAHKRTLSELAEKGEDLRSSFCPTEAREYLPRSTFKSHGKSCLKKIDGVRNCHRGELSQGFGKKEQKGQPFVLDLDAFCSVCGSSRKDADNCLLECSSCLIRVHQACYGVSRVPKDRWCCRPCRANSKDNVCVLCGYKGGAMTQALKSRNIVKGLLEAWSIASESMSKKFTPLSETSKEELRLSGTSGSGYEVDSKSVTRTAIEQSPTALLTEDSSDEMDGIQISNDIPSNLFEARTGKEQSPAALLASESPDMDSLQTLTYILSNLHVHNSVTAGVVDSSVKQWVHMVCGLWTPGTRCPNVHTMSAFDISGVSCPPKNVVCSLCNRTGGSYIKCRVLNCSVHFHPWCAHQKSLLQSEVEGVDNDMVGFYGRCVLHATHHGSDSVIHPNGDLDTLTTEDFTCARTEGYKGRQKDGFRHNFLGGANVKGECLVPQEQIDAWLHINAQKPYRRGLLKPQLSDIEYDSRKEYARYKQAKGWKNLVVYKSGIHGLGLYTSQFISRGAMVVEYVGEIVGLRVADKREIEYQSGRKLQYKSACYFFRIDKECIIDATRKGGIARFVNHSCLPNCVAKIISARNEKKVVFFAERDIYPGEEVTYDYHFNHEDEGEKIPCFCNSKNCRRYLN